MHVPRASWPNGPFHVDGTDMIDASGKSVRYAGVNWPAHMETMVPEGLQYQSIEDIVGMIKSIGMNAIRLTWAVEMVDDILDRGGDVLHPGCVHQHAGPREWHEGLRDLIMRNPELAKSSRLEVREAPSRRTAGRCPQLTN